MLLNNSDNPSKIDPSSWGSVAQSVCLCKNDAFSSEDMLADRQTDTHTHTDVLITILR